MVTSSIKMLFGIFWVSSLLVLLLELWVLMQVVYLLSWSKMSKDESSPEDSFRLALLVVLNVFNVLVRRRLDLLRLLQ